MTTPSATFQIPIEAAEGYETTFVPKMFAEWAPRLLDAAGIRPAQSVLDVACGTGIVARTALPRVTPGGRVVGVDLNEAMLTVARRVAPDVDFRQGDVAALPFLDDQFDVAVCQMGLMFFPDRVGAVSEMRRVVVPGGTVAIVVPAGLHEQPAYGPFVDVVCGFVGTEAKALLSTYFSCGDLGDVAAIFEAAELDVSSSQTRTGIAQFDSADALVAAEIESTPLMDLISKDDYRRIREAARDVLSVHVTASGELHIPFTCHLVVGIKARA